MEGKPESDTESESKAVVRDGRYHVVWKGRWLGRCCCDGPIRLSIIQFPKEKKKKKRKIEMEAREWQLARSEQITSIGNRREENEV
jgi:hypothetical protein